MKSCSFLQIEKKEVITTGIFTRVHYLRINEYIHLTIEISGYLEFHRFLTKTILYNCMIVIGIYHRCFNYISIDKLTTHESFASVSDFSVNNFTYQSNCYSRYIYCQAIILLIADTYL